MRRKSKGMPKKLLTLSDATIDDIEVGDICWVNYPYEEDRQKDINGDSTWGKSRPALVINKNINEERPLFVIKGTTSTNDKYNPSDVIKYINNNRFNCNSIAMLKPHHFLGLIEHIEYYNSRFQDIIQTVYHIHKKGKLKFSTYEDYDMMNDNKSYIDILNKENSKNIMKSNCRWDEIYAIYNTLAPHERLFLGNRFIDSPNTVFRWVIQCNGENAGYMELYDMKKSGSHKKEVVVSTAICPQYRGIGILEELEKEAENFVYNSSKYNKLIWYAKDDNKRSFKCANRLGYTKRFHELDHWVFDKTIEHKELLESDSNKKHKELLDESYEKIPMGLSEDDVYCNMSKFKNPYNIIFVCGTSGSGKSTLSKQIRDMYNIQLVSLDNLMFWLFKKERSPEDVLNQDPILYRYLVEHDIDLDYLYNKYGNVDKLKKLGIKKVKQIVSNKEIRKMTVDFCKWISKQKDLYCVVEGLQTTFLHDDKEFILYPFAFKGTSMLKAWYRRINRDDSYIWLSPTRWEDIVKWSKEWKHDVDRLRKAVMSNCNDIYVKKEENIYSY